MVLAFVVPNELDGQRLDRFVHWRIPRLTRERARDIVAACAVTAEGRRRAIWERVRAGEEVLLVRERFVEPPAPRTFEVLHQDEAITVVDKPPGLPVHPSATYHRNTLTALLRERFGPDAPHICHRLDRETSGLVVCAAGADEVAIKRQFAERAVNKEYLAIVLGEIALSQQIIDAPLRRRGSGLHLMMEVHASGLSARTEVHVVERRGGHSLVRLVPLTGRQHQLRVHLASVGHPIVGDKLYGPHAERAFLEFVEQGMTEELRSKIGHDRHALHAHRIELTHPRTGERACFEAPLAADLRELWAGLP